MNNLRSNVQTFFILLKWLALIICLPIAIHLVFVNIWFMLMYCIVTLGIWSFSNPKYSYIDIFLLNIGFYIFYNSLILSKLNAGLKSVKYSL